MKKRLLFITANKLIPTNSGDRIFSLNILKSLSEDFDLTLCCISDEGDYTDSESEKLSRIISQKYFLHDKLSSRTASVIKSVFFGGSHFQNRRIKRNSIKEKINELGSKIQPDLVVWDHLRTAVYYYPIKAEHVLIEHNNESQSVKVARDNQRSIFVKYVYNFIYHRLCAFEDLIHHKMDKVIFISKDDLSDDPKSVCLGYLPIDFNNPIHIVKSRPVFNLLFVGSMDWYPNSDGIKWFIDNVIELLPVDVNLTVVGRNIGNYFLKMNHPRIRFFSSVPSVVEFYEDADLIISPIFSGSGINIKILEALSYGIPIVPSTYSLRGYTGLDFLEAVDEPKLMAAKILFLRNNALERTRISRASLLYYENYRYKSKREIHSLFGTF